MQQNAKKEIKSPFSQGNSKSKSYNEDYNKDTQLKNESLPEDKLSKYNTSSAFIKTTYSVIPKSSYLKKQIKNGKEELDILKIILKQLKYLK